jgi:hypothetical protein
LSSILHNNPKGKFVTRVVQIGTEPLFDDVITPQALTTQVINAKSNLSDIGIPVTVSELAYGYQERGGAQDVLDAIDSINVHMLPFFAGDATTGVHDIPIAPSSPKTSDVSLPGQNAWPDVLTDLQWFISNGGGKKMYFDEVRHLPVCYLFLFTNPFRMAGRLLLHQTYNLKATPQSLASAMNRLIFNF